MKCTHPKTPRYWKAMRKATYTGISTMDQHAHAQNE